MLATPAATHHPRETIPVQPSDGPEPLPHTRSRPLHWIGTATALAAVLGLSVLVQPPAGATAAHGSHGTVTGPAPDAARARYPLNCPPPLPGEKPLDVLAHGSADFDGDGRAETVALVRCRTGIGTAPSGIFVLAPPTGGGHARPQVVETLLPPGEGMNADHFRVEDGRVSVTLLGYSSDDVPRCCPDRRRAVTWDWDGTRFVVHPAPVAQQQRSV
jgi:hypothetical protein